MDQIDVSNLNRPITLAVPHIHTMTEKCDVGPDRIFGKTGKTYYACIGGKEVCNLSSGNHGVRIPQSMIEEFDAHMAAFRLRHDTWQRDRVAAGRSTGEAGRDQQISAQRLKFTAAAVNRARASGARPNMLEIRQAAETAYPTTSGTSSIEPARVTSAAPAPSTVAPAQPLVEDQRILAIPKGKAMATVIQELGSPHGRIAGGMERLTYRLTSGKLAKIDFVNGVVSEVRIVPN